MVFIGWINETDSSRFLDYGISKDWTFGCRTVGLFLGLDLSAFLSYWIVVLFMELGPFFKVDNGSVSLFSDVGSVLQNVGYGSVQRNLESFLYIEPVSRLKPHGLGSCFLGGVERNF